MIDPTMTSEDIFNVLITKSPLLRTQFMETMRTAMVVASGNLPLLLWGEQENHSAMLPSNERIVGQDITAAGKRWETSKPESTTGIGLLLMVLDNLGQRGLENVDSLTIKLNDIGLDIQEITLSYRSSTKLDSQDTSGEPIQSILTQLPQSTRVHEVKAPLRTGLSHRTDPL